MRKLVVFLSVTWFLSHYIQGQEPQNCLYEVENDCDMGDRKKCVDQECTHVRTEWHWYDADGDGEITDDDDRYAEHIYECQGKIGYYGGYSYYTTETTASDNLPDGVDESDLGKSNFPSTVYCWQKAGCPVQGCSEATDLDDPSKTVWYCAEPEQTAVDDEDSKVTEYRISPNSPCPEGELGYEDDYGF